MMILHMEMASGSAIASHLPTGFVSVGGNPLSELTVRSLADMGYTVDATQADPFFLNLSAPIGGSAADTQATATIVDDD